MIENIITPVGISIFLNSAEEEEKRKKLKKLTNKLEPELINEEKKFIDGIYSNIEKEISEYSEDDLKKKSAELNGILNYIQKYQIASENLTLWFISTDTYLSKKATDILIQIVYNKYEITGQNYTIKDLKTGRKEDFENGIKEFLRWIYESFDNNQHIILNLTSGFKSLSAYMGIIGMFIAKKMIYIFEGSNELIEIPRLPIQIDQKIFKENICKFILLNSEFYFKKDKLYFENQVLFEELGEEYGFSVWGELLWEQVKNRLLDKLIAWDKNIVDVEIIYENSFKDNFRNADKNLKIKTHEAIGKFISKLIRNNYNFSILKQDGGLQDEFCKNRIHNNLKVSHFRIDDSNRISYAFDNKNKKLYLINCCYHDVCK